MLCFGVVQPLAKSSNATLQSAAATDCLACKFNKKYDFYWIFEELELDMMGLHSQKVQQNREK
jgi:hypothetical protein